MNKHLLIHLQATYYANKFNLTQEQILNLTGLTQEQYTQYITAQRPSNKQLIQAMDDLGIDRKEICDYLHVSKQLVSRHLQAEQKPYESALLKSYNI